MPTIDATQDLVTFISTYEVSPENLSTLETHLIDAAETVMSKQYGYISASIHKSLDGKHLTVYAQWKSPTHFQAMQGNPEAQLMMKKAHALSLSSQPQMFKVVHTNG